MPDVYAKCRIRGSKVCLGLVQSKLTRQANDGESSQPSLLRKACEVSHVEDPALTATRLSRSQQTCTTKLPKARHALFWDW